MTDQNVPPEAPSKPFLNSHTYDVLKPTATIVLPGLATLYFAIAQIWGLPKAEEVVGSTTALCVFLGLLLGLSTRNFNASGAKYDGAINLLPDEQNGTTDLEVSFKSDNLALGKKELVLKVNPPR